MPYKVFELANELGIRATELIPKLQELGIEVKNHMTLLSDDDVAKAKKVLAPKNEEKQDEQKEKKTVKVIRRRASAKKEQENKDEVAKEVKAKEPEEEKDTASDIILDKESSVGKDIPVDEQLNQQLMEEFINREKEEKEKDKNGKEDFDKEQEFKDVEQFLKPSKDNLTEAQRREKKAARIDSRQENINIYDIKRQQSRRFMYGQKKKPTGKSHKKTKITTPKAEKRKIRMEGEITVATLAKDMGVKLSELIKKLMGLGVMATANQKLDYDTAVLVAGEFSYEVENQAFNEEEFIKSFIPELNEEDLETKPPVVTVMGHVDHGKTSILDVIRKANVAAGEHGGITQRIGAYEVELNGKTITFIDTPGHETFTEMRARGAQSTDIVVLVVAADDGVMPQTKESINHARAAGVEIIVAVNKIDKDNANPDMVKQQLAELDVIPEEWGGNTIFVNVSALKNIGIDKLLEAILLQAEMMELKARTRGNALATVIESRLDKGLGPVATVVVREGTLKKNDYVVAGDSYGKVRFLKDTTGKIIKELSAGHAGELLGFNTAPPAGTNIVVVNTESDAKKIVEHRVEKARAEEVKTKSISLEDAMQKLAEANLKELKLLVKADTQGAIDALVSSLSKLSDDKIKVSIIHSGVGAVSVSDVNLALASEAVIIAYGIRADSKAKQEAEKNKLEIRYYDIVYRCLEDIEKLKDGLLEPIEVEEVNGVAEVRQTFVVSKLGTIAGSGVKEGSILRNSMARLIRDGVVVYTGKIKSLKRFKDDIKEAKAGQECGIIIEGFNDIKVGDLIESFSIKQVSPLEAESYDESRIHDRGI